MIAGAAFPSGATIDLDGELANLDIFFDTVLSSMSEETVPYSNFFLNSSIEQRFLLMEHISATYH